HQIDESIANLITKSNSLILKTKSTNAKSDNDASNIPTIKKTKLSQK
ncbi:7918_t:CDS:1, partial [Dentiscutata heterogama]